MVLRSLFPDEKKGYYLDIGAHHPVFFSNTYHFYLRGWKGINIDAIPGSMNIFKILRPNDLNIEACISDKRERDVTLYMFEKPALNTINEKVATQRILEGHKCINKIHLDTLTLSDLLQEYNIMPSNFDILNIDIEGLDEIVLRNNDWSKLRPKVLVFEDHSYQFEDKGPLILFMESVGYKIYAKCGPSIIMKDMI